MSSVNPFSGFVTNLLTGNYKNEAAIEEAAKSRAEGITAAAKDQKKGITSITSRLWFKLVMIFVAVILIWKFILPMLRKKSGNRYASLVKARRAKAAKRKGGI